MSSRYQHVNESPSGNRSGARADDDTTSRETCSYDASSVPLPFCVDVVCLGTQATGASSVYGGPTPSADSNEGRCCASYVLTVDGAPLVLFGAGHGVVREYLHTFGGLLSSPSTSHRPPPTAMLPPFIFIPANTSSAAAELPTLLSVERGKQKLLFEQHLPHNHSDDDEGYSTTSTPTLTSSSSSSDAEETKNHVKVRNGSNKVKSDNVFRITVIAEKGVSEALEHHRLAEVRDLMLKRMRSNRGGDESNNTLEGNLCNFSRLGISSRSAVIQTALPHAPRGKLIATNTLISEGYMTPVFRATLGANPLTSTFLRTAASKLVSAQKESSNFTGSSLSDWLFECDAFGNYPIVGSVTDVLLISCVGIDGMSNPSSTGSSSGSCGMTLWHERVGTASRNVHFNVNDQTIQSKLRKAKANLKRRRVKCARKQSDLEARLMKVVKAYASAVAASQIEGALYDDDDEYNKHRGAHIHLEPTTNKFTSSNPAELLATVVSIRKELALLSSNEKKMNAKDNAEVEKWSAHYEEVLVPRRPLLTITGDATFSTNLMEELFLAQPPTSLSSKSMFTEGTALDVSNSTHHHHHHGGAADGGASSEVFILPCSPDVSISQNRVAPNSRHHQHFYPPNQLPYMDFYPDTVTHPFDNNAPDVARQAASLYGAVRKVTDDAVNKVVAATQQQKLITASQSVTLAQQKVTVEEARQRLVTKQGSPTELRMYRRLLLVGKDPLTTSIPDGSFFAGDSKLVKVIPGSITTEVVTERVLVEKTLPSEAATSSASRDDAIASLDMEGLPTISAVAAGAVTAVPSMTSGDTPSDKPIIHWSGGNNNINIATKGGHVPDQQHPLPPPSFNPSSAVAESSIGANDDHTTHNNLSVAEIIGWCRGGGSKGRAKRSTTCTTRVSETSLTQWLSMFKQACIESISAPPSSPVSEGRIRFLPPRVFLGHHHSGSAHHHHHPLPQDSPSLGMSVLVPGAFVTVTGEPYLSTTMLALREATSNHGQHQQISDHHHTKALPHQAQPLHQSGSQHDVHHHGHAAAESLSTPTSTRGATFTHSPATDAKFNNSRHPTAEQSNASVATPEGIIQSPRPTTTSLVTNTPPSHTPTTAIRQTKRVFFYSNENLSQRPKLLMVPYLLDPSTEREYSQEPDDTKKGGDSGKNGQHALEKQDTTPSSPTACSIAVLKQRVGAALGFLPPHMIISGKEDGGDSTAAVAVVDRLYLIQSPPLLTEEHELLSSSSLLSTPTHKVPTHPLSTTRLVGVEITSVTQIPPNSSVVVTRMGGYGFDPTRLPYLLRANRDDGQAAGDAVRDSRVSPSSEFGLVLTAPPTTTAGSEDGMNTDGSDTIRANVVVPSPLPSSRLSVQLRPMSLTDGAEGTLRNNTL